MSDQAPTPTVPTATATPSTYTTKRAHYHPIKVSAKWAAMVAAMQALATNSPDQRAARDRERHNETTYARGELGGN